MISLVYRYQEDKPNDKAQLRRTYQSASVTGKMIFCNYSAIVILSTLVAILTF